VLLALVFLLATMVKNRRLGVRAWKSSSLPVLRGLDPEARDVLGAVMSVGKMSRKAGDVKAVMRKSEDGWGIAVVGDPEERFIVVSWHSELRVLTIVM
jgi:hypothetical protein